MTQQVNLGELFQQYKTLDQIQALPNAEYDLEVTSCKERTSGSPGVQPSYKVLTGPNAGQRVLAGSFVLTDKSRSIFFRNMNGFGFDEAYFQTCTGMAQLAKDMTGRQVRVTLEVEEYNGENRNKIPIGKIKLIGINQAAAAQAGGAAPIPQAAPAPVAAPVAVAPAPVAAPIATAPQPVVATPPVAVAPAPAPAVVAEVAPVAPVAAPVAVAPVATLPPPVAPAPVAEVAPTTTVLAPVTVEDPGF